MIKFEEQILKMIEKENIIYEQIIDIIKNGDINNFII